MKCPLLNHNSQVERFCINLKCIEKTRLSCNECYQSSFHCSHLKDQNLISDLPDYVEKISTQCERELIKFLGDLEDQISELFFSLKDKIRSQFQISSLRLKALNYYQVNEMLCQFMDLNSFKDDMIEIEIKSKNLLNELNETIQQLRSKQIIQVSRQETAEANSYYIEGLTLFSQGEYLKALKAFDTSLNLNPYQIEVMLWRGDCLFYSSSYRDALQQYKQVFKIEESNIKSLYGIGDCLFRLNQYQEAIHWLDQVLKYNPKNSKALSKKGDCLKNLKNYYEAIILYDNALSIDSNLFWTLQSKGSCLQDLKQFKEAIDCYEKALILDSKSQSVKSSKSYCEEMLQK
ncbi:unnamed protein product [Paramecium primaurelia]|uniref:Tetratricopeptide repeat protein n=1 Tax=Paramecium primaurelia TaxID=5886 RepID=A0A8S1PY36_PARPR|nr:unnamed protein product [Paramecium primaurelia]